MKQHDAMSFVEENVKTIFAYALSRVSNKEDAEDLAQDIILAILQSAPKMRNENAFFGYVWAIAANTYKKFLRKRSQLQYSKIDENLVDEADFTENIVKEEEVRILRRELSLLSHEYRKCTIAYYYDGLSCGQIADKFHITLEMVKYYLFKTRKIMKEGISMEREFGEKSFRPAAFEFNTIFSGDFNAEYRNLFNRKLPGNILLSAYYTPMTIRELSVELGVASAYLEDEIAMLEKYHLLTALHGGKYQTKLIIFTEDFTEEFHRTVKEKCQNGLFLLLDNVRKKLPEIRKIGFIGSQFEDNRLLWPLLWMLMRKGHREYENIHASVVRRDEIYEGATGVNYGTNYEDTGKGEYGNGEFAGYFKINDDYAAAFANFGILPEKNHYGQNHYEKIKEQMRMGIDRANEFPVIVLMNQEMETLEKILSFEIEQMQSVYSQMVDCAVNIMKVHAPVNVASQVEQIISSTIFFRTVGLFGACAVKSGAVEIPAEHDYNPIACYIYRITEI